MNSPAVRVSLQLIDSRPDIHRQRIFLGFLGDHNLRPGIEFRQFPHIVKGRFPALPEPNRVARRCHAGHGVAGSLRQQHHADNLYSRRTGPVEALQHIPGCGDAVALYVHILSVAGEPDSQRGGERHNLVGTEACGIGHIDPGPPDTFLEKTHHVQMTDKTHRAVFAKLNTHFHILLTPICLLAS